MIKKIILVPQTHTDIGYTELPHKAMAMHVRYLRQAMKLCEDSRNAPEGEAFKWVVEAMVVVKEFLKNADLEEREQFFSLVREGRIEITGFDTQSQTQLLSVQELDEELKFARELAARENLPINTMVLDDIGGLSWNLPQFMNRAGIKNYVMGVGGWRVLTPLAQLPHLFRYYGVDGKSSCLMYLLGLEKGGNPRNVKYLLAHYGFGIIYIVFPFRETRIGGDFANAPDNTMTGDQALYNLVKRIESEGYPFDTLMLQTGSDNAGPYLDIVDALRSWNSRHRDLTLSIGTHADFFDYIEGKYGDSIPKLSGEITCSWSEHVLTQGRGIGEVREAARILNRADMLVNNLELTQTQNDEFYKSRFEALENIRLFKDHTFGIEQWGLRKQMAENHCLHTGGRVTDYSRASWNYKQDYALSAKKHACRMQEIIDQAVILSNDIPIDASSKFCNPKCGNPEVTFVNPLPYKHHGLLRFHVENIDNVQLKIDGIIYDTDREKSNDCGSEYSILPDDGIGANRKIVAEILPVKTSKEFTSPFIVKELKDILSVEWLNAKLLVDKNKGSIESYMVNELEMQDSSEGFHLNDFNQYHIEGVLQKAIEIGLTEKVNFTPVQLVNAKVSVVFVGRYSMKIQIIRFYGENEKTIQVESEIELIKNNPSLFLRNRVRKIHAHDYEAGYFVFPIKVDSATWQLKSNQQGYIHDFLTEKLPGAALQNFAFQDFVVIGDQKSGAVVSSKNCTILSIGKAPKYYSDKMSYIRGETPHLFMYCYNNLWVTNTAPEQINGDMWFDFVVQPLPEGLPEKAAEIMIDSKAALNDIGFISGRLNNCEPYLVIDSKVVDYYFSSSADGTQRQLNLVNMSREEVNFSITLAGKKMNITLNGAEVKSIRVSREMATRNPMAAHRLFLRRRYELIGQKV